MNREDNFTNDSEDNPNEDTSIQARSNAASYWYQYQPFCMIMTPGQIEIVGGYS